MKAKQPPVFIATLHAWLIAMGLWMPTVTVRAGAWPAWRQQGGVKV